MKEYGQRYTNLPHKSGELEFLTGNSIHEHEPDRRYAYALLNENSEGLPLVEMIYNIFPIPSKDIDARSPDDPHCTYVGQRWSNDQERPKLIMFHYKLFSKFIAGGDSCPTDHVRIVPERIIQERLGMPLEPGEDFETASERASIPLGCYWTHRTLTNGDITSSLNCNPGHPTDCRAIKNVRLLCPLEDKNHIKLLFRLGPQPIERVAQELLRCSSARSFSMYNMFHRWVQFVSFAFYNSQLSLNGRPTHLGSLRLRNAPRDSIANTGSGFDLSNGLPDSTSYFTINPHTQMSYSILPYFTYGILRSMHNLIPPIVYVRNGKLVGLYEEAMMEDLGWEIPEGGCSREDLPFSVYTPHSDAIDSPAYVMCDGELAPVSTGNLLRHYENFVHSRGVHGDHNADNPVQRARRVIEMTGLPVGNLGSLGVDYPLHGSAIHNHASSMICDIINKPSGGVRLPTTTTINDLSELASAWGVTPPGDTNSRFFSGVEDSITFPAIAVYLEACASRATLSEEGDAIYDRFANQLGLVYLEQMIKGRRRGLGSLLEATGRITMVIRPSSRYSTTSGNNSSWGRGELVRDGDSWQICDDVTVELCRDLFRLYQQMMQAEKAFADKLHRSFCKFGFQVCDAELAFDASRLASFKLDVIPWPGTATHRMPRILYEVRCRPVSGGNNEF